MILAPTIHVKFPVFNTQSQNAPHHRPLPSYVFFSFFSPRTPNHPPQRPIGGPSTTHQRAPGAPFRAPSTPPRPPLSVYRVTPQSSPYRYPLRPSATPRLHHAINVTTSCPPMAPLPQDSTCPPQSPRPPTMEHMSIPESISYPRYGRGTQPPVMQSPCPVHSGYPPLPPPYPLWVLWCVMPTGGPSMVLRPRKAPTHLYRPARGPSRCPPWYAARAARTWVRPRRPCHHGPYTI